MALALLPGAIVPVASNAATVTAEVLDRILATVNGRVILQSDMDEALAYEALLSNRASASFSDDDRRTVLDRLIDQELLREQMSSADFHHATAEEVNARIAEARQKSAKKDDAGWLALLDQYHIREADLFSHVQQEIEVMRLVDARLRPAVQIDSKSIEAYYRNQFVPKLRESGAGEVPLDQVSGKIRELLTQEKVSEMLVSWLQTLRAQGEVRIPGAASDSSDPGVQAQ